MAYPTSIDSFTNPGPTDTMDGNGGANPALYHDAQHDGINNAVVAVETFVGTTSAPNFVNGASIATVIATTEAYALTQAASVKSLALLKANNLSDVADAGSSRFNISTPTLSAVAAVAVASVSLASPGATLDGYTLQSNDEVLLTNQTSASANGVWLWSGSVSALTRPNEFPTGGVVTRGRMLAVINGTSYANTQWILDSTAAGLTIDTSSQTWSQVPYITANSTNTVTNKRITKRVLSAASVTIGSNPAINTDLYDVVHFTGMAASIASLSNNLSGNPVDGDTLRVSFTDNGTPRGINWNSASVTSFEAAAELPTTTVANQRLDVGFYYNTETGRWRCEGAAPGVTSVYQDIGSSNVNLTTTPSQIFNPLIPSVGTWRVTVGINIRTVSSGNGAVIYMGSSASSASVATYTLPSGASGQPGAKMIAETISGGTGAGTTLTFITDINVTALGVIPIWAVTTGGTGVVAGEDSATVAGVTIVLSSITCDLIG